MTGNGITRINGIVPQESITYHTEIYTLNNRRKRLPLDQIEIAIYEGIYLKYTGIQLDGTECQKESITLSEAIDDLSLLEDMITDYSDDIVKIVEDTQESKNEELELNA